MTEIKVYGALLLALLVGAYVSWTAEDLGSTSERVTLFDVQTEQIEGIDFFTKTQTIAFGFRGQGDDRYPWFELTNKTRTRGFAGNKDTEKLLKQFAPLEALRSLGKDLTPEELSTTKLDAPERKLIVKAKSRTKTFDVGGRTNGARDHYARARGSTEVFLIDSKTLSDLQFPDGKYMQRKLRNAPLKEVARIALKANDQSRTAVQKNRLSPTDAFWTADEETSEADEGVKNFISKLERITATDYVSDEAQWKAAEPVLSVEWFDEDGKSLGSTTIAREGSGKKANYYARADATRVPVKISRFAADGLEKDLTSLFD